MGRRTFSHPIHRRRMVACNQVQSGNRICRITPPLQTKLAERLGGTFNDFRILPVPGRSEGRMNMSARLERLFEDYERHRSAMADTQQRMRAISVTASSSRREVSVTAGQGGVLTDIQFPTAAYKRMTLADLTRILPETFDEANEQVFDEAAAILTPMLPDGLDAGLMVQGAAGVDAYLPAEPRVATSVRKL